MHKNSPERSVQVAIVRWLRLVLPGAVIAAVKNEHAPRSIDPGAQMRFFAKRKAEGVLTGFPDITVWPLGGKAGCIEVKAPGGRVSAEQSARHLELQAAGYFAFVADSIESARLGLQRAGVTLHEAPNQPVAEPRVTYEKKIMLWADAVPDMGKK